MCTGALLLLQLLSFSSGDLGVDMSSLVSVAGFNCLRGQGFAYAMPRVFMDAGGGQCDGNGFNTWKNANAAGVRAAGYIFPNPVSMANGHLRPAQQVDMALYCTVASGLSDKLLYLDIEVDPYNPWSGDCHTNGDWILEMIATLWKYSDIAGLYTSRGEWSQIACPGFWEDLQTMRKTTKWEATPRIPRWPLSDISLRPNNTHSGQEGMQTL